MQNYQNIKECIANNLWHWGRKQDGRQFTTLKIHENEKVSFDLTAALPI